MLWKGLAQKMTNYEKYFNTLKKIADNGEAPAIINGKLTICGGCDSCKECAWKKGEDCTTEMFRWLMSNYKAPVKLSNFARAYLNEAREEAGFKYMARTADGVLYLFSSKPKKETRYWNSDSVMWRVEGWVDDFSFVKWGDYEPWSIDELLEGVENNEN